MSSPDANTALQDQAVALNELDDALQDLPASWPDGVGELLHSFRPYLLAIANAELPTVLADNLAPSDIVQETLIHGLEGFAGFRGSTPGELARWLRAILQNQMMMAHRKYATERLLDPPLPSFVPVGASAKQPSPSEVAISREERQTLDSALESLPDDQRQAILLRHREDLPFLEIGRRLQRSEEAARKLWARGVIRLQKDLRGHAFGPGATGDLTLA